LPLDITAREELDAMATAVDRMLEKLRVFHDALPEDEQQVLQALLRQSQAEAGEVAGYIETKPVLIPPGKFFTYGKLV
jgi:hypothetical protein